jgi:diphthine synthase
MLYLIGLGLNKQGISQQGLEAINRCKKIYLENYTVEFPYSKKELEKVIGKEIEDADRDKVESDCLIKEAKKRDIALLVYGSPLTATTHISLVQEAKKQKVKFRVIYNASVFDAVAETGLQIYKFGKIASMPSFEADSFTEVIKENQRINAHSLILVDIGLEFNRAVDTLKKLIKNKKINISKIVVCSRLGCEDKNIYYNKIENLKDRGDAVKSPFCFIIPGKLHFMEKEVLENFGS